MVLELLNESLKRGICGLESRPREDIEALEKEREKKELCGSNVLWGVLNQHYSREKTGWSSSFSSRVRGCQCVHADEWTTK